MRIAIADDEKLVRYSLKDMLCELDLPIQIVGEAENGQQLLDVLTNGPVDIVFVDIRMPVLNGLDTIKKAKESFPGIRWIILTGYSEFTYAKQAVQLGAFEYLLKPVNPVEVESVVKKVMMSKKQDYIIQNEKFENRINAFFHLTRSCPAKEEQTFGSFHSYLALVFVFDTILDEVTKVKWQISFCNQIRDIINNNIDDGIKIALFTMPELLPVLV